MSLSTEDRRRLVLDYRSRAAQLRHSAAACRWDNARASILRAAKNLENLAARIEPAQFPQGEAQSN